MVLYPDEPQKVTAADAGAWVDNARGIHMSSMIIRIAEGYGYPISEELKDYLRRFENQLGRALEDPDTAIDDWEFASEEVRDAEDWMNEHVAPRGYYFGTHPDFGDWGLYSVLMGHDATDLAGVEQVARDDIIEYVAETDMHGILIFERKSYDIQEIAQYREILPEFVDIVDAYWDKVSTPERYVVEVEDSNRAVGPAGRRISEMFSEWVVSLHGKPLGTAKVYEEQGKSYTAEQVKQDLIRDHYDPAIVVTRMTKTAGRRLAPKQRSVDVYLGGKLIDTVFYDEGISLDQIRKDLIGHDGYDPKIVVAWGR
jgi:hypothetical protein